MDCPSELVRSDRRSFDFFPFQQLSHAHPDLPRSDSPFQPVQGHPLFRPNLHAARNRLIRRTAAWQAVEAAGNPPGRLGS